VLFRSMDSNTLLRWGLPRRSWPCTGIARLTYHPSAWIVSPPP